MESFDPRVPNPLYAMMIMMIIMMNGELWSTNTDFIICDDDDIDYVPCVRSGMSSSTLFELLVYIESMFSIGCRFANDY